jgi:hypothetical protein
LSLICRNLYRVAFYESLEKIFRLLRPFQTAQSKSDCQCKRAALDAALPAIWHRSTAVREMLGMFAHWAATSRAAYKGPCPPGGQLDLEAQDGTGKTLATATAMKKFPPG